MGGFNEEEAIEFTRAFVKKNDMKEVTIADYWRAYYKTFWSYSENTQLKLKQILQNCIGEQMREDQEKGEEENKEEKEREIEPNEPEAKIKVRIRPRNPPKS